MDTINPPLPETPPESPPAKPPVHRHPWAIRLGAGGLVLLAGLVAWWALAKESFVYVQDYVRGEPLLVYPCRGTVDGQTGEQRELRFTVWNRTGEPVKILGSRSSCGCMVAADSNLSPVTIPPGGKHEFGVVVGLGDKPGEFTHKVTYYTDAPGKGQIDFVVDGRASVD